MSSDPIQFAVYFLIGGIAWFYFGLRKMRQKKMMESVQTSKIRSLAIGLVEIYGEVVPTTAKSNGPMANHEPNLIKSPLTNTNCVYYRYVVEKPGYKRRITVTDEEKWVPFFVKDETGSVLVDLTESNMTVKVDNEKSDFGTTYEEYLIVPKDSIYVLGRAESISYDRKNGEFQGIVDLVIQKSRNPDVYVVMDDSEKEFNKEYGMLLTKGLIGGGVMIIAGLVLIFLRLGV